MSILEEIASDEYEDIPQETVESVSLSQSLAQRPKTDYAFASDEDGWEDMDDDQIDFQHTPKLLRSSIEKEQAEKTNRQYLAEGEMGFSRSVIENDFRIGWSARAFYGVSRESAAALDKIAQRNDVPFEHVLKNPDEWQINDEVRAVLQDVMSKREDGTYKFPRVARFLMDPVAMRKAGDDIDSLKQYEAIHTGYWGTYSEKAHHNLVHGSKEAAVRLLQTAQSIAGFAAESGDEGGAPQVSTTSISGFDAAMSALQGIEGGRETVNEAFDRITKSEALNSFPIQGQGGFEQFTLDAVGIFPQLGGAITTSVLTGSPVGSSLFMMPYIYGGTYSDLVEQDVDEGRAAVSALFNSSVQSVMEVFSVSKVLKLFKSKGMKQYFRRYVESVGTEQITETMQGLPESISQIWGTAVEKGLTPGEQVDAFLEALPQTLSQSSYEGLIAAFTTAVTGGLGLPMQLYTARKSDKAIAAYDKLMEVAAKSTAHKRDPAITEQFLKTLDPDAKVYVSTSAVQELFQSDPHGMDDLIAKLNIGDQITEALATGKDLEVSLPTWVKEMAGTSIEQSLRGDVRFDLSTMTENELKVFKENFDDYVKEAQDNIDTIIDDSQYPEELTAIRAQLMKPKDQGGGGYKAQDADDVLDVFLASAKTLTKQTGETTEQWFKRVNPTITTDQVFEGDEIDPETGKKIDPRGSTQFTDGATIINLFKGKADKTTLAHELSHIYMKDMKAIVDHGLGDDQFTEDYLTLVDFANGRVTERTLKATEDIVPEVTETTEDTVPEEKKAPPKRVLTEKESARLKELNEKIPEAEEGVAIAEQELMVFEDGLVEEKKIIDKYRGKKPFFGLISIWRSPELKTKDYGTELKESGLTNYFFNKSPDGSAIDELAEGEGISIDDLIGKLVQAQSAFREEKDTRRELKKDLKDAVDILTPLENDKADLVGEDTSLELESELDDIPFQGGPITSKGAERIAEAFEQYILEGKAPSVKLANAFTRLSEWFSAVYNSIAGTGIKIDDTIREVFDRTLAAGVEIKEAQDYYKNKAELSEIVDIGERKKKTLARKKEKGRLSALDKQVKALLQAYLSANGDRAAITEQAEEEVEESQTHRMVDGVVKSGSFNATDIESSYGPDLVKQMKSINPSMVTKNGKVTFARAVIDYGYANEEAMLRDITGATSKSQAIQELTDKKVLDLEAEIREFATRDETVPGDEAYHNPRQLDYLVAEYNILIDQIEKIGKRRIPRLTTKVLRDTAEEKLKGMTIKKGTRYDSWARTEERYSSEWARALAAKDFEAAYKARRNVLMNHALVQASVKARDARIKWEAKYKPTAILKRLKNVEYSFQENVKSILQAYGLTTAKTLAPNRPDNIPSLKSLDDTLNEIVNDWIHSRSKPEGYTTWKDLTIRQMEQLDKSLDSIITYGSDAMISIEQEGDAKVSSFVQASKDAAKDIKNRLHEFGSKARMLLDGAAAQLSQVEFDFEKLDGYSFTKNGVFGPMRKLFNRGVAAETAFVDMKNEVFEAARPHWKVIAAAVKRLDKNGAELAALDQDVPLPEMMRLVSKGQWSGERVVTYLLNQGNKGNQKALTGAYGFTAEQEVFISQMLETDELAALQGIWDSNDILFKRSDEVFFNIYNQHVEKVKGEPVSFISKSGEAVTLDGGYYPLQFDNSISTIADQRTAEQREKALLQNQNNNIYRKTTPEHGNLTGRVGSNLPPELSTSVWVTNLTNTARFISHAEYLKDMNRVTLDPGWAKMAKDKLGAQMYSQIRSWVQYQSNPTRRIEGPIEAFLESEKQASTVLILGADISVGIKQRLSMLSAVQEIGLDWVVKGFSATDGKSSILGLKNVESWQKVLKMSPYMRTRGKNIDREISDLRGKMDPLVKTWNLSGIEFTKNDVMNVMMEFIQMNDRATVGVVWQGAFMKSLHLSKTSDEDARIKEAVEFADAIVRTTQPSTLPIDLNKLQRSEGYMRFVTSFMTWTFKNWNRMTSKVNALRDKAITPQAFARHFFLEYCLASVSGEIISSLLGRGELPEWYEMMLAPVWFVPGNLPVVRDLKSYWYYGQPIGTSIWGKRVSIVADSAKDMYNAVGEDQMFAQWALSIGRAIEAQTGILAIKSSEEILTIYDGISNRGE